MTCNRILVMYNIIFFLNNNYSLIHIVYLQSNVSIQKQQQQNFLLSKTEIKWKILWKYLDTHFCSTIPFHKTHSFIMGEWGGEGEPVSIKPSFRLALLFNNLQYSQIKFFENNGNILELFYWNYS